MTMEINTLFPTVLGITKIQESESIKKKFANKIINKFKTDRNLKAPWAEYSNTWQTHAELIDEDLFKLFYTHFQESVHKWFEVFNLPPIHYRPVMWVNVHTYEMYQDTHAHDGHGCILCGNYNLKLNQEDRPTQFTADRLYESLLCQAGVVAQSPFLTACSNDVVDIAEGDLVLFSPDLKHCVPCAKKKHDEHRITLSFNIEVVPASTSVHPV